MILISYEENQVNNSKKDTDLISTNILKIDEIIGGGIPRKFNFLISGEPGTMKSTLATWILFHNLKNNKILMGYYILFEQDFEIYEKQIKALGMELESLPKGLFNIIPISIERIYRPKEQGKDDRFIISNQVSIEKDSLKSLLVTIFKRILNMEVSFDYEIGTVDNWKKHHSQFSNTILVIDSLSILDDFCHFDVNRAKLVALLNELKRMNFTTIIITEKNLKNQYAPEKYLTDGIIILEHKDKVEIGTKSARSTGAITSSFTKTIKCEKMRTKKIDTRYYSFEFINGEFKFNPYKYVP